MLFCVWDRGALVDYKCVRESVRGCDVCRRVFSFFFLFFFQAEDGIRALAVTGVHSFFSSRRRHTRCSRDWSSDVCSSDLARQEANEAFGNQDSDKLQDAADMAEAAAEEVNDRNDAGSVRNAAKDIADIAQNAGNEEVHDQMRELEDRKSVV